jgi:uncharacterized protein
MLRVKTKVRPSPIHGLGLFAAQDIECQQTIWVFDRGFDVVVPEACADVLPSLCKKELRTHAWQANGLFFAPLDGARFINHADKPNAESIVLVPSHIMVGDPIGSIVATRSIARGEEITVNYNVADKRRRRK